AQRDFAARYQLKMHRTMTDEEAAADDGSNVAGISHAMVTEHYALPGQVVVGTDSHTPHSGALGCVAFGVGTTDMSTAFVTGDVAADEATGRFLEEGGRVDFAIESWMKSDPDSVYERVIQVDCTCLSPNVASPGDPGNGIPLNELDRAVKIDIAYGGSCTA